MLQLKHRIKKASSAALSLIFVLSVLTPALITGAEAAPAPSPISENLPSGRVLVSETSEQLANGIVERTIVTNTNAGDSQNVAYVCEIDLKGTPSTEIVAGYGKNYDASSWSLASTTAQAEGVEQQTVKNVVAAVNGDFFDMTTGQPIGLLVMNGTQYASANGRAYFCILNDGSADIRYGSQSWDDVKEAVGGDKILVENGQVATSNLALDNTYETQLYTRAAIGIKADGTVVSFSTHGMRAPTSCGETYTSVAQMMVSLGCQKAIMLDGGGSVTYASQYEGHESENLVCRNSPSDGNERLVSSTLMFISNISPTGVFDHATISPNNTVYTPGSSVSFTATGVDAASCSASIPANAVWALADESYGSIDSNGNFTSNGTTGEVAVNLTSDGTVIGSTSILIEDPDSISFFNDEVSMAFGEQSELGLSVKYKGRDVNYKEGDFSWAMSDASMGSFNGNTFTSSDSATVTGTVTATYTGASAVSGSLTVVVGRLPTVMMDFEDYTDPATGTVTEAKDYWSFDRATFDASAGSILQLYDLSGNKISSTDAKLLTGHYCNNSDPDNSRGGMESAEIVDIASGEPVRFGNNALKLNYDFSNINGVEGACVGFSSATSVIEGTPTAIGMWVYCPDGTPNLWLRMRLRDGSGSTITVNFTAQADKATDGTHGGLNWTGWKYVEADLTSYTGPFSLIGGETIRVMHTFGKYGSNGNWLLDGTYIENSQCKGSIYVDNLRFVYGSNVDDTDSPVIDSVLLNNSELTDGETVDSNTVTIKSMFHDADGKYATGIDYSTVYLFVDGVDMTKNDGYILRSSDNALYLYNLALPNGKHTIKVLVRDGFGNETTETRTVVINGSDTYTGLSIEPSGSPYLNQTYTLKLNTNNISDVSSVNAAIVLPVEYGTPEVTFGQGFSGSADFDKTTGSLKITAARNADTPSGGTIAGIAIKVPDNAVKGSRLTYSVSKGEFSCVAQPAGNFGATFSGSGAVDVKASYTVSADVLIKGQSGKIYVTDESGTDVEGANVYANSALLGTTASDGSVDATSLCSDVSAYSVYAEKDGNYSFALDGQSVGLATGDNGSTIIAVLNVANDGDTASSKNVTWVSEPTVDNVKAVMQLAAKSDYDQNGEQSFKDFNGTCKNLACTGSGIISENLAFCVNDVTASGLTAGTEYVYRVGDGTNWSEIHSFTLTPENDDETNLFILGDTQPQTQADTKNLAAIVSKLSSSETDFDLGIHVGDLVENAALYSNWEMGFDNMKNIEGGSDVLYVVGNHELFGDDGSISEALYSLPDKNHYSVEYGDVYIATISFTSDDEQLKEDLAWLVQDAKKSNAKWKILATHQPAYYTNPSGGNETVHALLPAAVQEAGIDMVFSGHDHTYARTEPLYNGAVNESKGITYFVCGVTGEKIYAPTNNPDYHFAKLLGLGAVSEYPAVYLTAKVTGTTFTVEAHNIDGTVIDTYTKTKTAESSTDIVPGNSSSGNPASISDDGNSISSEISGNADASGTATAELGSQDVKNIIAKVNSGVKAIDIEVKTDSSAKKVELSLPAADFKSLADSTDADIKVETTIGSISFNSEAVEKIANGSASGNVQISISKEDTNSLSDKVKAVIGDKPVFSLSVTAGDKKISDFGGGIATVSVPYSPSAGEDPDKIIIYYISEDGSLISVPNCKYDPATGNVTFETKHFSDYAVAYNDVSFTDVSGWYKDYVDFLSARKIISGTGDGKFSPNANITRAQFVTILANLSGDTLGNYKASTFSDVRTTDWYSEEVQWAYDSGIVKGSDGKFNPNANITRQDIAVMALRYAENCCGATLPSTYTSTAFADSSDIASYASGAVTAMQKAGILNGKDGGRFAPTEFATRAEAAKISALLLQTLIG